MLLARSDPREERYVAARGAAARQHGVITALHHRARVPNADTRHREGRSLCLLAAQENLPRFEPGSARAGAVPGVVGVPPPSGQRSLFAEKSCNSGSARFCRRTTCGWMWEATEVWYGPRVGHGQD